MAFAVEFRMAASTLQWYWFHVLTAGAFAVAFAVRRGTSGAPTLTVREPARSRRRATRLRVLMELTAHGRRARHVRRARERKERRRGEEKASHGMVPERGEQSVTNARLSRRKENQSVKRWRVEEAKLSEYDSRVI